MINGNLSKKLFFPFYCEERYGIEGRSDATFEIHPCADESCASQRSFNTTHLTLVVHYMSHFEKISTAIISQFYAIVDYSQCM
jgi:hypothetical protein